MNCCKHKYFVLYRGDSSDFPGNQELIVEINTTIDLTGCSAHFQFQDYRIDFDSIPADNKLHLVFPSSETKKFTLGSADAKLWLTYGSGADEKTRTVENRIHIVVTNNVNEAYNNDDPQAITVTISGGGGGETVVLDDTVTETSSNGVKSSGIWSWVKSLFPSWLTSDYAEPATVASVANKADEFTEWVASEGAPSDLVGQPYFDVYNWVWERISGTPYFSGYEVDPDATSLNFSENGFTATRKRVLRTGDAATPQELATKFDKTGGRIGPTDETGEQILPQTVVRIGRDATHILGSGGKLAIASGSSSGGDVIVSAGSQDDVATLDIFGDIFENSGEIRVHMGLGADNGHLSITHTGDKNETLTDRIRRDAGSLVSTNNPAFVSAVQDTPTSGMPEDMPTDWGAFGTVGAALAALAAGLKWCKNILGSLASGYSTFADWIASKLDRSSLLTEYSPSSAYSVGAIVYHDGNIYQCKTAIAEGGEAWNAEHWELRKLDDFFTESNSLLTSRVNTLIDAKVGDANAVLAAALDGTEVA